MISYVIRRLLIGFVTLLLITFIIFALIRNMPGDPLAMDLSMDPSKKINPADFERMKAAYGLDMPWPQAYVQWVGNLAHGDMGRSLSRKRPVDEVIGEHVGPTLILSVSSLLLTYLLAIPMGLGATVRSGKADERVGSTLLYMLYSFPGFVAALFMQIYLSVKLGWLPLYGMTSTETYETLDTFGRAMDILKHAIMPVICYTYGTLAYYTRFIHANMQEVIRQDYIRTAKAKGAKPVTIILHHAFRNTLIPLVTLFGLTLPGLLGGSVIIERIFQWPGMGQLYLLSINARDYPTIMGLTLMFAVLTLAGQLLADILYAVVDPRIRLS